MLYLVATPIGNLEDITLRALKTLQSVDGIICEDTRRTGILLNHFQIKKPLLVLNDFRESSNSGLLAIVDRLKNGEKLALVSDAGTPLISDPGFKLVKACIKESIEIDSLPGPSSVIQSLTLAGLPTDKFIFLGYLPDKPGHRQDIYQKIKKTQEIFSLTFIIFVAPFKLIKSLEEMQNSLGDLEVTLASELTKVHQKVKTQKISEWLSQFKKTSPKGEWVLLFHL